MLVREYGRDNHSEAVADEYVLLSKLFVLAEKLMDDKSKAVILDSLAACALKPRWDGRLYYPGIDAIQIIYEGTPEGSCARAWLVDVYTQHVSSSFLTEKPNTVPKDFLQDLSISLLTKRSLPKEVEVLKEEKEMLHIDVQRKSTRVADLENKVKRLEDEAMRRKSRIRESAFGATDSDTDQ